MAGAFGEFPEVKGKVMSIIILGCGKSGELDVPATGTGKRMGWEEGFIRKNSILQKVLMEVRSAFFTVIGIEVLNVFLGLITHTETMLPYVAFLALYHELSSVDIVLSIAWEKRRVQEK